MTASDDDRRHMAHALMLGRRGLGRTAENPAVGCVLLDSTHTLAGVGWTQAGGRPHAEAMALAMAGARARGGTAYVTLEPCNHTGRTPPCSRALIEAGVARVVIGALDPHPQARGGADALRAAGIAVETGVMGKEAARAVAGFLTRVVKKRPYVILKLAVSADGYIAARSGERTAISGSEANARVHLMRSEADAVMIGIGTAIADDPSLTCRLPGMADRSPMRVVIDAGVRLPASSILARTARAVPVTVFHAAGTSAPAAQALAGQGVTLHSAPRTTDGGLDLQDVLRQLALAGVNTVLCEGGARLGASLLRAGLVDALAIVQSERPLGQGVPALDGMDLAAVIAPGGAFAAIDEERLGADVLRRYEIRT